MKVGWIGLGKLGLPCALVLAQHHEVWGYDVSDVPWKIMYGQQAPMQEEGLGELLDKGKRLVGRADSVSELVQETDIIFVAVQTPHAEEFGGEKPVTSSPQDFEYAFLVQACRDVARAAEGLRKEVVLVVVSTVLPGTTDRLIRPLLNEWVSLAYSPQFIAMGTTVADFRNPEFVICGVDHNTTAADWLAQVFLPVHGTDKRFICDIVTAESIKVFYNTYISMKIVWANHVMELCHKTGANCDDVVDALALATDRVISPKYMRGGMGDGGACHPRDLIAMSWLEEQLVTSTPLFADLALAREAQTEWLANLVRHYAKMSGLKVVILGMAYKPESDLIYGSPALLLRHYLDGVVSYQMDTNVSQFGTTEAAEPYVYVVATKHEFYPAMKFWPGSVVIDPFGYIPDQEGVTVIRVGRQ